MRSLKIKFLSILGISILNISTSFAQVSKITKGLSQSTSELKAGRQSVSALVIEIAAYIAIIGLGIVAYKYFTGDRETAKTIITWGGGILAIFIGLGLIASVF